MTLAEIDLALRARTRLDLMRLPEIGCWGRGRGERGAGRLGRRLCSVAETLAAINGGLGARRSSWSSVSPGAGGATT